MNTSPLLAGPVAPESQDFPLTLGYGVRTWEDGLGMTRYRLDTVRFEFWVDCSPDALAPAVERVLAGLRLVGLEPMDDIEPELLDDDWVRIWFVPMIPVDDTLLIPFMGASEDVA